MKTKESRQQTSESQKVRTFAFFQYHQFEVFILDDNCRQRYASLVFVVYFAAWRTQLWLAGMKKNDLIILVHFSDFIHRGVLLGS